MVGTYTLNTHTHTHTNSRIKITHQMGRGFICLHWQLQYIHTFSDGNKGMKHENNYTNCHSSEMLAIANMMQLDPKKKSNFYSWHCVCWNVCAHPSSHARRDKGTFFLLGAQTSPEMPFIFHLLSGKIYICANHRQCKYLESWEHSGRIVLMRLPGSKHAFEMQF